MTAHAHHDPLAHAPSRRPAVAVPSRRSLRLVSSPGEWLDPVFDETVLHEHVLDRHVLDEHVLDEHVLDEHVLDEHVLDEHVLDDGRPAWSGADISEIMAASPVVPRLRTARQPVGVQIARLVVAVLVAATALFLFFPAGVEADSAPLTTVPHVVQPGDTLWRLAEASTPAGSDLRATIDQIRSLNGLESSMLITGDVVMLPVDE